MTVCGTIFLLAIAGMYLITMGMILIDMKRDLEYGNWSGFFFNLMIFLALLAIGLAGFAVPAHIVTS
jgi:hypothetical protein